MHYDLRWLLAAARRDLSSFFAAADPVDAELMEGLVLAHAAVAAAINAPRTGLSHRTRRALESATDEAERLFMAYRDDVRRCGAFRGLSLADRTLIEQLLFEISLWPSREHSAGR